MIPRHCYIYIKTQFYTTWVHAIQTNFSFFLFLYQIAFSQHNSIMDLVQFFVTFFRWVIQIFLI